MTDPGPFAPPSGALPPRPAAEQPPPTAPVLPPPTGQPVGVGTAQVLPPPPRRRRWLIPVIVGGALGFVALAVGVGFAAAQLSDAALSSGVLGGPFVDDPYLPPESADLMEGEPGSPLAVDPLACEVCFTHDEIVDLDASAQAYVSLGLPLSAQDTGSGQAGTEHRGSYDAWRTQNASPDECFFSYSYSPLASPESDFMLSGDPGYDDEVYYYGYSSSDDQYYVLTPTGRLFDDTAAASAHLGDMDRFLAACSGLTAEDEFGEHSIDIQEAPALDVPASVAALAWTQTTEWGRAYQVDLQRGNLVVRLSLNSDGYGPTEAEFRTFVEDYARQLGALELAP